MSNTIESGSNMGAVDMGIGVGAQTAGCTDIATTKPTPVAEAPQKDVADQSGLDQLLDVSGGFWDEVTGATARLAVAGANAAGQAAGIIKKGVWDTVDEVVDVAATKAAQVKQNIVEVSNEIQQMARDLNEVMPMPPDLSPQAQKLYREAKNVRKEMFQAMDKVIERQPQEVVRQAAQDLFTGRWNPGQDLLRTVVDAGGKALDAGLQFADKGLADGYLLYNDTKQRALTELEVGLTNILGDSIIENKDVFQKTGAFLEAVFDNRAMRMLDNPMTMLNPWVLPMNLSRTVGLKLAGAIKDVPGFIETLKENPEAIRDFFAPKNAEYFAKRLDDLEIGATYQYRGGLSGDLYAGPGGAAGIESSVECTRVAQDTYEVSVSVELMAAVGLGEKMGKIGADASLQTTPNGKVTLVVTGENARMDAARLMGLLSNQQLSDVVRLKDVDFSNVRLGSTTVGTTMGAKVDIHGANVGGKYGANIETKTIDGQDFTGMRFSWNPSAEVKTPAGLQIKDELAKNWLDDPKTGNPAVDSVLSQLPEEVVTGLKQFYGPTAAVDLSADAKISGAIYRPDGRDEPTRIELQIQGSFHAGASTIEATTRVVIPSVEDLARELGANVETLKEQLVHGEFSLQELQQGGAELNKLWEFDGPEIVCKRFNGTRINVPSFNYASGVVTPTVIYKRGENTDVAQNLRKALAPEKAGNSMAQLATSAQTTLQMAHVGRM